MADIEAVANTVRGILAKHEIPLREGDGWFAVLAPGKDVSAVVRIHPKTLHGEPGMMLESALLTEVEMDSDDEERPHPLIVVNDLNRNSHFGRYVFYPEGGTLALEYDLLASSMQESEFIFALGAIGTAADDLDDRLQSVLGGRRALEDKEVKMA